MLGVKAYKHKLIRLREPTILAMIKVGQLKSQCTTVEYIVQ